MYCRDSQVEFRDDQISAHSSTADTYDTNNNVLSQKKMQISDVVQKIEELCVSSLIETDIFEHNSYLTYIMGDINIISWNALHRGSTLCLLIQRLTSVRNLTVRFTVGNLSWIVGQIKTID